MYGGLSDWDRRSEGLLEARNTGRYNDHERILPPAKFAVYLREDEKMHHTYVVFFIEGL